MPYIRVTTTIEYSYGDRRGKGGRTEVKEIEMSADELKDRLINRPIGELVEQCHAYSVSVVERAGR